MCELCDGYGHVNCPVCGNDQCDNNIIVCPKCNGTGKILYIDDSYGEEISCYDLCDECNGLGEIEIEDFDQYDVDTEYQLRHGK